MSILWWLSSLERGKDLIDFNNWNHWEAGAEFPCEEDDFLTITWSFPSSPFLASECRCSLPSMDITSYPTLKEPMELASLGIIQLWVSWNFCIKKQQQKCVLDNTLQDNNLHHQKLMSKPIQLVILKVMNLPTFCSPWQT